MVGKSQELADALKRFTLHSMQQYRARYLLARLTQHVEMAFSGLKAQGSLEPFTKLEIEHILPDNPKEELRDMWGAENPNATYDDYKNRLGNLTLLEKPINIVAGNDFYDAKQIEYTKSGNYLTRSLVALTDVGQNTSISRINAKLEAFLDWMQAPDSLRRAHRVWNGMDKSPLSPLGETSLQTWQACAQQARQRLHRQSRKTPHPPHHSQRLVHALDLRALWPTSAPTACPKILALRLWAPSNPFPKD